MNNDGAWGTKTKQQEKKPWIVTLIFNFNFQIIYFILYHMSGTMTVKQIIDLLQRAKIIDITFLSLIGGHKKNTSHWKERYEDKEMNGSEINETMIHN